MIKEDEKQCKQCEQTKPLSAFHKRMHRCIECYQENRDRRWRELAEAQETKRAEEHRVAKEATRKEFLEKIEVWYTTQTEQICARCKKRQVPRAFGTFEEDAEFLVWNTNRPPELKTICKECRYEQCCLCLKKKYKHVLTSSFNGYSLFIPGYSQHITLYCKDCEQDFLALPTFRQKMLIRTCSNRTFPPGQVVYSEKDPRTQEIRYIGRTGHSTRPRVVQRG